MVSSANQEASSLTASRLSPPIGTISMSFVFARLLDRADRPAADDECRVDVAVGELFGRLREAGVLLVVVGDSERVQDLYRVNLRPRPEVAGVDRRAAEVVDRGDVVLRQRDERDRLRVQRRDAPKVLDRIVDEGVDARTVPRERGDVVLDQREVGRPVGEAADVLDARARGLDVQREVGVGVDDGLDLVREGK